MSDQQPEVVIMGDDGTEHVFPPGFDPKRAAGIVRNGAMYAANQAAAEAPGPLGADPSAKAGATGAITALRVAPAVVRSTAGVIADSPAAQRITQKLIMGTVRGAGAMAGHTVGGVPGAIAGAAVTAGLTPTQASIRGTVGRLAGEAPAVTDAAIKAHGIMDYGKGVGIRVAPGAIVDNPAAGSALDNYAESMGKRIVRLYGPSGEIVSGPQAQAAASVAAKPATGVLSKVAKVLPALQAATAVTDFAQTVEPNRHDIGVMGIGRTAHVPGEHPALINALIAKLRSAIAPSTDTADTPATIQRALLLDALQKRSTSK